ncbi:Coenzyme F420 hydrogenase/dehydrogenase, beta subunit C-terminal domain [Butyrivibrio sp. XPD2002]|uniref:Coenzyme F420 hydrogenase/dehydrogenase, beta subunit C-terminal domain n=1 Tax=Butyrivibrio sp. XPD2002 TaxID=1280665 RepID=UPI00040C9B41|nr:Coenzyme F420 hydrogenase/dehydrogenase, beta subunit C-terminal domain [Butyrivibrio sp. XPD2002]
MKLCDIEKCTGCGACVNICPKKAIAMAETDTGKTVWSIDETQCVECGMCEKTCPVLNSSDFNEPIKTLAAWTLNEKDQQTCASGGIATALYKVVLEKNGTIYGCDYDSELKPVIRGYEDTSDLEKFKSSKYVQSITGFSYQQVKEDLNNGRMVLYIGTPCQIDGLQHFLGKKYSNLYTVDIICHGVPPYKYFQEYIASLGFKEKITSVAFRGKRDFCLSLYNEENLIYWRYSDFDYYYLSFLRGIIYRDNCYECRYAKKDRISDITIGDFWGLDKKTLQKPYDGRISTILVNTSKGQELLDMAVNHIYVEERLLDEALKYNEQLNHPMVVHEDREIFLNNLDKGVYKALCSTRTGKEITRKRIKNKVRKLLGRS